MKSFRQYTSGGYVPPTPEERADLARERAAHFERKIAGSKMTSFDRGQYTEIGHAATTGGIGSNADTELWVHHDDKIMKKRLPEWRPHGAHHDVFGMGELNYPEGGPRKPAGRIDHALKAISLQYDPKTPSHHVERVVQQLRKAHPDYVIRDYEQNKYVHEGVAKDIAKVLGTAAVAGAVAFGAGKSVKQQFPSKPEAPIAKTNAGSKPVSKPTSTLQVPKDVKAKMPAQPKAKEPEGHADFHARLQKHFGEEYPIILAAAKRNGIAETDHENLATLYAIRKAENGKQGKEFGVLHPKAKGKPGESREATLDRQAGWAAATIVSKRRAHEASKQGGDFVQYLGSKYAPVGAENDPSNLNKNWHKNVSGWRDVFHGKKASINEDSKPKILTRLTNQLRSKGVENAAGVAIGKLRQFGLMQKDSLTLTDKGTTRNKMSPGARAKSRAAKYSGGSPKDYTYNSKTNRATKKD